jgi:restriction endonuclease
MVKKKNSNITEDLYKREADRVKKLENIVPYLPVPVSSPKSESSDDEEDRKKEIKQGQQKKKLMSALVKEINKKKVLLEQLDSKMTMTDFVEKTKKELKIALEKLTKLTGREKDNL